MRHEILAREVVAKHYGNRDRSNLTLEKLIAAALSQVEAEALASKVVFPTGKELSDFAWAIAECNDDAIDEDRCEKLLNWIKSQVKLAPKEPEVKAQGFEDFLKEAKEIVRIKKHPDQVSFEDLLNFIDALSNIMANAMYASYLKGQASQVRLPEKKVYPFDSHEREYNAWTDGDCYGYNAAIDDMRKLNGLEK